jgi:lipoate-protein ligase B
MIRAIEKFDPCFLNIIDCGLSAYGEILQLQHNLRQERLLDKIPNTVLLVEHSPVITLGARKSANKLLKPREELAKEHIEVFSIRRGGGTTAHNPGQLVFYPIINLSRLGLGISEYVRQLEAIGIELLKQFNVQADRRKGFPGIWVGDKKIASIGVRVSKAITYHGMAINISNDLGIFEYMIPCGLEGVEMTSVLKETSRKYHMSEVKKRLSRLLTNHFSSEEPFKYENRGQAAKMAS